MIKEIVATIDPLKDALAEAHKRLEQTSDRKLPSATYRQIYECMVRVHKARAHLHQLGTHLEQFKETEAET